MRLPGGLTAVAGLGALTLAGAAVAAWTSADDDEPRRDAPVVVSGAELFVAKGCAVCHDGPDTDSSFDTGPSLRGVAAVAAGREPGLSAANYVRRSIASPGSFVVPGFSGGGMGSMPALPLSADEIDALAEYLLGETEE